MDHLRGWRLCLHLAIAVVLLTAGLTAGVALERSRNASAAERDVPPSPRERLIGEWVFAKGSVDKYEAVTFYPNGTFDFRWRDSDELASVQYRWVDDETIEVWDETGKGRYRVIISGDVLALINERERVWRAVSEAVKRNRTGRGERRKR